MREHGILNRILLIYEEFIRRENISHDMTLEGDAFYMINYAAQIVRKFIEDHHEKTEEKYVFPYLLKMNKQTNLINELLEQHALGRTITDKILELSNSVPTNTNKNIDIITNKKKLCVYLYAFVYMYRFHESREDTVIFVEFRDNMTLKQYKRYGEIFEEEEEKKFGKHGIGKILKIIEYIEKYFDIYDLNKITTITVNKINGQIK
jgi:hemerythrin-like domain-containing protein